MAKTAVQTEPGSELNDKHVRAICRKLVREQGWQYSWVGGGNYPQLTNPEGVRTYVPRTPSDYHFFMNKVKRLGAVLDGEAVPRRSSFDGESLRSDDTEKPWTEAEWRAKQQQAGGWRAQYAEPLPEPEPVTPLTAYQASLMDKLTSPHVRSDATGNGQWTLKEARQMLLDGYSLDRVIERTGWGRMWLEDLVARLAAG